MVDEKKLPDYKERKVIREDFSRCLAVDAGAGSGKTHEMVERITGGIAGGKFSASSMAAITFTRRAAAELRARIIERLQQLIADEKDKKKEAYLQEQLVQAVTAQISTIHSFCAAILKEKPIEAAVDPAFEMEDDSSSDFFAETFREFLEENLADNEGSAIARAVRKLLIDYGFDLFDSSFEFKSKNTVESLLRTLVLHRDAELAMPEKIDPKKMRKEIDAFFKSSIDLADQFGSLPGKLGDLRDEFNAHGDNSEDIAGFKLSIGNTGGKNAKTFRDEIKEEFAGLQKKLAYALRYPELKKIYVSLAELSAQFIDFYREKERREGVLDNEDLLIMVRNLLKNNRAAREYFKRRFRRIFVDEFQDTDPVQTEIIFFLGEEEGGFADNWQDVELEEGKLFIIGDIKQAIYNFRRADVRSFMEAMEKIGARNRVVLSANFRSTDKILDFVNGHFCTTMTGRNEYMPNFAPLDVVETRKDPSPEKRIIAVKNPDQWGEIDLVNGKIKADEFRVMQAQLTALWLAGNRGEVFESWSDVTVLVRGNKATLDMQRAFERYAIPLDIEGSTSYFGRYEVQSLVVVLKAIADSTDTISLYGALKGPFFGHNDRELFEYFKGDDPHRLSLYGGDEESDIGRSLILLKELHRLSLKSGAEAVIMTLLERTGALITFAAGYLGREKVYNMIKAMELARSRRGESFVKTVEFLESAVNDGMEMGDLKPRQGERDAVTLMTVHKAKGLESEVIYIADAAWQPFARKDDLVHDNRIYLNNKDLQLFGYEEAEQVSNEKTGAEEERLRYVAATRAKRCLVFNYFNVTMAAGGIEKGFVYPYHQGLENNPLVEIVDAPDSIGVDIHEPMKAYDTIRAGRGGARDGVLKWKESHDAALEKGRVPVLDILSPSAVQESDDNVNVRVAFSRDDMETTVIEEAVNASALGTVIHRMLERGGGMEKKALENLAEGLAELNGLEIKTGDILNIYKTITGHEVYKRSIKAKRAFRELPILFNHENRLVDGVIDLLFEEEGGWTMVDYKVLLSAGEKDAEAIANKYRAQAGLYAAGLKKLGIELKEEPVILVG